MADTYTLNDLLNIAISIEQRGVTFYDVMAKSADNDDARIIFEGLVAMEHEHIEMFRAMLSDRDTPVGEAGGFQTLIDSAVFTDDMITGEMATQADSDVKALEIGISAEKDSILLYYELREQFPEDLVPDINMIIAEEKSHLRQLSEIKKKLETM